jgi:hypothetical protein
MCEPSIQGGNKDLINTHCAPLTYENAMDYTFVVIECNIHGVSAYADGSEASLGVGIIVRTVEELKGILGHIVLYNSVRICVCTHVCVCVCVHVCVCVYVHICMM